MTFKNESGYLQDICSILEIQDDEPTTLNTRNITISTNQFEYEINSTINENRVAQSNPLPGKRIISFERYLVIH